MAHIVQLLLEGNESEFSGRANAVVEWPGAAEYTLDGAEQEENVPSVSRTNTKRRVFAPAGEN